MEYVVLLGMSSDTLNEKVNAHIKDGWRPMGGMAANNNAVFQAMVREPVCIAAPAQPLDHAEKVINLVRDIVSASYIIGQSYPTDNPLKSVGQARADREVATRALYALLGAEDI